MISIEHLTKTYRLGSIGGASLQVDFARWWARMLGRPDPLARIGETRRTRTVGDKFWALDDVSFNVAEGEVLGIIGRNGAGKSTLLKILSQVTAPTSGQVTLRGRVASLLEVGTGFHPELTGRENIYLNGAILGMTRQEIKRQFDNIVAFSECEGFIDTPVKRYSSGMYVRLAFAVAAHLEPEILIVDEVLAVGDAQFQNKCLGKMSEVSRGGRTVLFVSHNMASVRRLCKRAVVLDAGRVSAIGDSESAISRYLGDGGTTAAIWRRVDPTPSESAIALCEVSVRDASGGVATAVGSAEAVRILIKLHVAAATQPMQIAVRITNHEGIAVFTSANTDERQMLVPLAEGDHEFQMEIPEHFLPAGRYNVLVAAHIPRVTLFDHVESVNFSVEDTTREFHEDRIGIVTPRLTWVHRAVEPAWHRT